MPSSYILRNLTSEQSDSFTKALERAKAEGRSFRWVVIRLIERYATGDLSLEPSQEPVISDGQSHGFVLRHPGCYKAVKRVSDGRVFRDRPEDPIPDGYVLVPEAIASDGLLKPEYWSLARLNWD